MNMNMKFYMLAALVARLALQRCAESSAAEITASSSPGVTILDGDLNGVADTINLNTSISSITDVQLTLDISGGYDGDFYAYLQHGNSGFAVLLNRVGVTASSPFGSSDSGFDVTFSDAAANGDIHAASAGGNAITGTWQPDGRTTDPLNTLDTDPRTAFLSSFDGEDASGSWTFFIADVSPVGIGTLDNWGLTIDGNTASNNNNVPEAGSTLALLTIAFGGLIAFRSLTRRSFGLFGR